MNVYELLGRLYPAVTDSDKKAGNIHYYAQSSITCYVVKGEHGDLLIDTGMPQIWDGLKRWLGKYDVRYVLLTHAHADHDWNVRKLQKTGIKVLLCERDKTLRQNYMSQRVQPTSPKYTFRNYTQWINGSIFRSPAYDADYYFGSSERGLVRKLGFAADREEILSLIGRAKERDESFFGELCFTDDTYFIICDDEKLLGKLGEDHAAVTPRTLLKKHYICISDEYLDLDILAHEITHAELHTRLSRRAMKKVPTWFDEGLATQNDYRENYSEEQWVTQTDNGKNVVAREAMDTPQEFYAGEKEDRRLRYLNAKHEVSVWMKAHGQQGLLELNNKLNDGADFNTAYEE